MNIVYAVELWESRHRSPALRRAVSVSLVRIPGPIMMRIAVAALLAVLMAVSPAPAEERSDCAAAPPVWLPPVVGAAGAAGVGGGCEAHPPALQS